MKNIKEYSQKQIDRASEIINLNKKIYMSYKQKIKIKKKDRIVGK